MIASVSPDQISTVLERAGQQCRVLSLDCFDTLLWRNTHSPQDVFAEVGSAGGLPDQRRWAEINARSGAVLKRNRNEVLIEEIYAAMMPNASAAAQAAGVCAEVEAEVRSCFAFAPVVTLMEEAKRLGKKVIIVSDTYLSEIQLRGLIRSAAGTDVEALIDRVFCSSEYGVSKGEGLFRHVLRKLNLRAEAIVHVGDNHIADYVAPSAIGIPAVHLRQFSEETQQRLRFEAALASMLHCRSSKHPVHQAHRADVAVSEPLIEDAAGRLGHSVLGPIFRTFAEWLECEARAFQSTGSNVHLLFLMRDGFLPLQVFRAASGGSGLSSAPIEISRFTATAASFANNAIIDRFLEREVGSGELNRVATQLLLTPDEQASLGACAKATETQKGAFLRNVRRAANLEKIRERSRAFATRLTRHLRASAPIAPGDTVMLVDLGYNGSVQNAVDALIRDELKVHVAGRYLLLREQEVSGLDKRGMLDAGRYDPNTLDALCGSVAVLEQLCTLAQGSVVNYDEDGEPVRDGSGVKARQSTIRSRVQESCVIFAENAGRAKWTTPAADTLVRRVESAAAVMARLMFLPLPSELETLASFEHDVNLGTGEMVPLFDRHTAAEALREQGMFYLKGANRMFLPAELRGQGLPLSLALITQRRFGMDLRRADFQDAALQLPIIVADGHDVIDRSVTAFPTHDGFFAVCIPVGDYRYAIGVQLGKLYEWVEVSSVDFVSANAIEGGDAGETAKIQANISLEGLELCAPNLIKCVDPAGFIMIPPGGVPGGEQMILRLTFRPIVCRERSGSHSRTDQDCIGDNELAQN